VQAQEALEPVTQLFDEEQESSAALAAKNAIGNRRTRGSVCMAPCIVVERHEVVKPTSSGATAAGLDRIGRLARGIRGPDHPLQELLEGLGWVVGET
jgi:hypothetical protein